MKSFLSLVAVLAACFSVHAQNPGSISGKVQDESTREPIPYATILIKDGNQTVTGGITDDNGVFSINNLALQSYVMEVQFMGYGTYEAPVSLSAEQRSHDMGTIRLKEEATQLDDVEVVGERSTIEQKIDRKVINVGRDLTTAGATASEIMNNIPSVNVDQDGRLSLRGNENVRVLVDGRPTNIDPAQLLRQIPSTSIKKIELITNPSAKYNPEGMSGIINIILHKNANDGFNASVNGGLTIAQRPKVNSSINMNYRTGKVNFFGTYGNNFGDQLNWGNINRGDDGSAQIFDIVNDNNSHLFKIGMDYYLDDKNTVSVYTNQNRFHNVGIVNSDINFPDPSQSIFTRDRYENGNENSTYNLAYKHLFAEGHTLEVEANYNYFSNAQDAFFNAVEAQNASLYNYTDVIRDRRENTLVNVDYVNPLKENTRLELGAEARLVRSGNNFNSENPSLPEENRLSHYTYDLDIYSAYATFGQNFSKFSYQLGARLESYKVQAVLNGESAYEDDYITVYPSAFFSYALSDRNQFQLSYSRRVDRPSLEQTKPIREFSTPRVTSIGNPELDPQFTNSLELNYTRMFEKGSMTAGVFYRQINDEINRVVYPNPDIPGNLILSFDNFDNNSAYGFEVSANYRVNSWWDLQPAVDFSNIRQKGLVSVRDEATGEFDFETKEVDVAAFNARLNNNFKATKSLRFLLFGFYRGQVEGIQFTSKEMYKIDLGARYSLLDNKATLSVRFNDIFNTMRFGFDSEDPYPQTGQFRWESRSVFIGFNYSFGSGKNRAMQRRYRDDNTKQGGGGII